MAAVDAPRRRSTPLTRVELTDGLVLLGPPVPGDAPAVTAACQDPTIARWTTVPSPYRTADAVAFIGQHSEGGWRGEVGLSRVDWRAFVGNEGSRRVVERCGFTVEGTLRSASCHRGTRRDEWVGGVLAAELR